MFASVDLDTDADTLNDGDEIILGLDPNDPETFGVPDAEYKVKQTISADSEVMERVNTEDSPYELSLEITASGNAQNLIAGSSAYSATHVLAEPYPWTITAAMLRMSN